MRTPVYSTRFRRDARLAERRGKDIRKLRAAITLLVQDAPLPARLRDHALRGDWVGYRDLHVEPDGY